jgi:hypothetical protein
MTNTYLTGNPLGSTAAKDLYDNASNFDEGMNSPSPSFNDRFNKRRETWAGMEASFQQALLNTGFEFIGNYDDPGELTFIRRNQVMLKDGAYWSPAATLTLPYTTVNNWFIDQPKFIVRGDAVIRADLYSTDTAKGVSLVYGAPRYVNTVAEMLALPRPWTNTVYTLHHSTVGDGGGAGPFYWDPSSAGTANGGSVFGTGTGRIVLINRATMKPEQFGAKGDWNGTVGTDDSAYFANISLHLATFGGAIQIGKRHYVHTGWVMNTSGVRIRGNGEVFSAGNSGQNTFYATAVTNVKLRGVKFSQPRTLMRGNEFDIYFVDSTGCRVENCKTDGGTAGIWFNHCSDMLAQGNTVDTPKADGIHFSHGSFDCRAYKNTVINPGDDGLATTYYDVTSGRPHNNEFKNNRVKGGMWGFGVAVYSGDNIAVENNNFSECALGMVVVTTNAGGGASTNVTVKGNKGHGLCRVNAVPENYWFGTPDQPITSPLHISAMVLSGTDVYATENTIDDVFSPVGGAANRTGLIFNGGALIGANRNTFTRVSGAGITCTTGNLSQLSVNDNTFDSVADVNILLQSVSLSVSASICGNTCGYGSTVGSPNMIYITGAGSVRTAICNNTSSNGRGVFTDGTSTNLLLANNNV